MASVQPLTTIFLGPQGCGKGTQISLLKEYLAKQDTTRTIVHFEMGKTLRELATKNDYTGRLTDEILKSGGLIPYAISASLFALYLMQNLPTNDEHVLIDGFPRTATQVPMLDSALVEFYKRPNPTVVCINISDEEAVKRLLLRGRNDDTEKSIRKRLLWSQEETMPNLAWFRANSAYKVVDINGEQSIEGTHKDVLEKLGLK